MAWSQQLAHCAVLQIPAGVPLATLQSFLRGQVAVSAVDSTGTLKYATGIQIAGVLDDLYYYPGKLGAIFDQDAADFAGDGRPIHIKVWAPTAQAVTLELFDHAGAPHDGEADDRHACAQCARRSVLPG